MDPSSVVNPFALFGLKPTFEIDGQQLAETFRSLQRVVHPDRFANASDQERRQSVEQAAAVNDAYQVLRDPVLRGRSLLALRGVDAKEDAGTFQDTAFLMEQMELRERLGDIRESSDPFRLLVEIKELLRERRVAMINEVSAFFRTDTPEAWSQAAEKIRQLRFFDRLTEEAITLEDRYYCSPSGSAD